MEAGGNLIDTAGNYAEGTSEKYNGEFVDSNRDYFILATKFSLRARGDNPKDPNTGGNSRKNLMRSVESSLERLNTDYIDLLDLHVWDYTTPLNEVMRALDDLVRAGKVHYIGFSDTPAYNVSKANMFADSHALTPITAILVPYNVLRWDPERELFPMAKAEDVAVTTWGMVGGGVFTRKYEVQDSEKRFERASEEALATAEKIVEISKEIGRSPAQVAINWVWQQQAKAQIIPILGARSAQQLEDNLGVLDFVSSSNQLEELAGFTDF
ncbi:MAG: aldo/keto reductase [Anaerolineales bacterium]|nr:aldo/keto reductase [Anaerolineales bacterium]